MWSWLGGGFSALLHDSSPNQQHKWRVFGIKNTALLFLLLTLFVSKQNGELIGWIGLGLVLSITADTLRTVSDRCQISSFVGFLFSFLCYSKAFWLQLSGNMVWWLPALLFASSIILFLLLLPMLDSLIFPVVIMGCMLVQMAWAAGEVWLEQSTLSSLCGFIGALVFILAGLIQALNKYRKPITHASRWVIGCYLLAQALIVCSFAYRF